MSYLVCHSLKFGLADLRGVSIHNNRESSNSSNKDIDYSRAELNFDALTGEAGNPHTNYRAEVEKRLQANYKGKKAIRKDAVRLASIIVSSDKQFFADMSAEDTQRFFNTAAEYLAERFGRENVVAAKVHMDETTPHMHFTFVPLTEDGRLSAKTILDRNSLRSLQDSLPKALQQAGFDIERGLVNSPNRHKPIQELKRETALKIAEQEQEQQQAAIEEPDRVVTASEAIAMLDDYIKSITDAERQARQKANCTVRLTPKSDNAIRMKAQAECTNGETTKILEETSRIKRDERKYLEAVSAWKKSKPTGLNPVPRYKYVQEEARLEKWKEDIEQQKAANQEKIDAMNKKLHEPETAAIYRANYEVLQEQAAFLKERYDSYNDLSKELNDRIAVCQSIRRKLNESIYSKNNSITITGEVYHGLKTGDVKKAKDIVTELRTKAINLQKSNEKTLKQRSKERENDGWER